MEVPNDIDEATIGEIRIPDELNTCISIKYFW